MRRKHLLLGAATAVLVLSAVQAASQPQPACNVNVVTYDARPTSVTVDRGATVQPLVANADGNNFSAKIPIEGGAQTVDITISTVYSDDRQTLPARLLAQYPNFTFRIHRPQDVHCVGPEVTKVETGSADDFTKNLESYFEAKYLVGHNECGTWAKVRVIKAWFDRSYNLMKADKHYRVDTDAGEMLKSAAPKYKKYVDDLESQGSVIPVKAANDAKLKAIQQGDLESASHINEGLVDRLVKNEPLRAAAKKKQHITVEQLRRDQAYISTLQTSKTQ